MRLMVRSLAVGVLASFVCVSGVRAQGPRVVQLSGSDAMTYSMPTITAKPGEELKIVLKVTSNLPPEQLKHNFVLLKPETDAMAFAMAAVMAKDTGYIPAAEKDKILAQTEMAANGQEVTTTFKAPAKPGTYPYVCTFPGHFFAGMKGSLIVK
jgi:azurin